MIQTRGSHYSVTQLATRFTHFTRNMSFSVATRMLLLSVLIICLVIEESEAGFWDLNVNFWGIKKCSKTDCITSGWSKFRCTSKCRGEVIRTRKVLTPAKCGGLGCGVLIGKKGYCNEYVCYNEGVYRAGQGCVCPYGFAGPCCLEEVYQ